MPTDGTDVKVYTVGPDYAHAEVFTVKFLQGLYLKWPTFFQLKSWSFTKSGRLLATFGEEGN